MNERNSSSDKPSTAPIPSSSPRWRSEILQPVVIGQTVCDTTTNTTNTTSIVPTSSAAASSSREADSDDNGSKQPDKAVIIPWSGWYGFFFQLADEQQQLPHCASSSQTKQEKTILTDDSTVSRTAKNEEKDNTSRFRLLVSWDNTAEDETTYNERFSPLPLRTDLGTSLTSLTVGRLVYFSEKSRVSVLLNESDDVVDPTKSTATNDDPTCFEKRTSVMENPIIASTPPPSSSSSSSSQAASSLLPQWQLVFQRHLGKTEELSTQDTGTLAESNTRFLMCGHCGKTVSKLKSMKQHQDFVHLKSTRTSESETSDPSISSSSRGMNGTTRTAETSSSIWTRPLRVLYQDDAMVIIVKPQGMAVMGNKETLQRSNLLLPLVGTRPVDWPAKKARTVTDNIDTNSKKEKETNDVGEQMEEDKILGKPRPAHRLDAPTGGVLVVSKTQRVDCVLKRIFRERKCHKVYRAIVHGKLIVPVQTNDDGEYGICNESISGKPSTTLYKPLRYGRASFVLKRSVQNQDNRESAAATSIENDNGDDDNIDEPRSGGINDEQMGTWLTVVELKPVTGRHHQLRRHLKGLGHAIVGDCRYGPRVVSAESSGKAVLEQNGKVHEREMPSPSFEQPGHDDKNEDDTLSRLCLWAMEITLPHPVTGKETRVVMEEPAWINHVLKLEQERWERSMQ
jgi:23S rRNA-/tRNA-specific pseudouridylate synthase